MKLGKIAWRTFVSKIKLVGGFKKMKYSARSLMWPISSSDNGKT